jgi:hypothetical protein
MTLSGLGGVQEFGCATSWRVQTKVVAAFDGADNFPL